MQEVVDALKKAALGYPETEEHFPWGESAFKVKGKVFMFMYVAADSVSCTFKLPESRHMALSLPFASPTGYGLGKSGWVSCKFPTGSAIPVDLLLEWLDESYRAVAPKKLAASVLRRGA